MSDNQFMFPPPFDAAEERHTKRKRRVNVQVPDKVDWSNPTILGDSSPKAEEITKPVETPEKMEIPPESKIGETAKDIKIRRDPGAIILKSICAVVGILALAMSFYLNSIHYLRYFQAIPAMAMSLVVCASSAFLPEVAIFFYKRWTRLRAIKAAPIFFVSILAMMLSMSGIIAGLYNGRSDAANIEAQKMAENTGKADSIAALRAKYDSAKVSHDLAVSELKSAQLKYDSADKKTEWTYYQRLKAAKASEEAKGRELKSASDALSIASEETGGEAYTRRADFYDWLGGTIGVDRDSAEFGFSVAPAVFLDVIAPFLLAVAFFL